MKFLIVLFLIVSSNHAFAENEIGFQRFKELIQENVSQKIETIEQDPLDAESYFNLGLEYMALGRTHQEIEAYLEAIHLYEDYSKAHYNLAVSYDRLKEGGKAIKHLLKAEEISRKQNRPVAIRRIQRSLKLYYQKYGITQKEYFIQRGSVD